MAKYQPYPAYVDSGIDWLGDVPAHWGIKKLKFLASVYPSNVDKKAKDGEQSVRLCNYTDVYYNEQIDGSLDFMVASATDEQVEKFSLLAGDTILTKDSEDRGDIAVPAYVPQDLPGIVCGYHLAMVRPKAPELGAYIKRFIESCYARSFFTTQANGLTRYGLGTYPLNNIRVLFPPVDEARNIAAFLDHETAKIDRLVARQKRLIELLKEKRQAVISHAVTKGLDPDAPMKDSGVAWLGEVPAHWSVCNVKHVTSFITSGPRGWSDYFADQGDVFLQSGDLAGDLTIGWGGTQKVTPPEGAEGVRTALVDGDVLVCITGANTGNVGLVDGLPGRAFINQHLAIVRPVLGKVVSKYLAQCLISRVGRQHFSLVQYGLKEGLSLENVREAVVTLPPLGEQTQIADFVDEQLRKLDALYEKSMRSIALMKEHRAALISAAVTGKIDVRNFKPANA